MKQESHEFSRVECQHADNDGTMWNYSLRSTKIDCANLAEMFGGGGHKGAAGFSSNKFELEVSK